METSKRHSCAIEEDYYDKRTVTIEPASGLEARPIAILVQLASSYESTIYVQSDK